MKSKKNRASGRYVDKINNWRNFYKFEIELIIKVKQKAALALARKRAKVEIGQKMENNVACFGYFEMVILEEWDSHLPFERDGKIQKVL
jgi:hypothetical protein